MLCKTPAGCAHLSDDGAPSRDMAACSKGDKSPAQRQGFYPWWISVLSTTVEDMKHLSIITAAVGFLALVSCDTKVNTDRPPVEVIEKNTTIVNPPAKSESKTIIVTPPAASTTEKTTTTTTETNL